MPVWPVRPQPNASLKYWMNRLEMGERGLGTGSTIPKSSTPAFPFSSLNISNLSYTYPGESSPALDNVSLEIQAGQHIALVGSNGAGKTTLANILLRFIKPTSGQITINHEPVANIPLNDWHRLVTWVPQKPYLFHDTLAANIRLGHPDATIEEVNAAVRVVYLEDFIESLPQKYETVIGEGGARLSSGEAQRLALARAFLLTTSSWSWTNQLQASTHRQKLISRNSLTISYQGIRSSP